MKNIFLILIVLVIGGVGFWAFTINNSGEKKDIDYSKQIDTYGRKILDNADKKSGDLVDKTNDKANDLSLVCCAHGTGASNDELHYSFMEKKNCSPKCNGVDAEGGAYPCELAFHKVVEDSYCY